jgi:hypothetical protein
VLKAAEASARWCNFKKHNFKKKFDKEAFFDYFDQY